MTNEEYAAIIRSMIEHENTLLNHRMTWMWTLQGLLFAAVGFMWEIHDLLVLLICAFGLCSCISVGVSLKSAVRAIGSLLKDWDDRLSAGGSYHGPPVIGSPGVSGWLEANLKPWHILPWLTAGVWILLAAAKLAL